MTIAVTGAGGFVGSGLMRELAELGHRPIAIRRTRTGGARVVPDFSDADALAAGMAGGELVVHCVGLAHQFGGADEAGYHRVNATLTEVALRAAAQAGARRFLLLSTALVNGSQSGGRPFAATDAPDPRTPYARSKMAGEEIVRRLAPELGIGWTILRPGLVYGPGLKGNLARLVDAIRRGLPLPLASVRNRRSLIGITNLAAIVGAIARSPGATDATYMASDGDDVSTPAIARHLAAGLGRRARLLPLPPSLLSLASRVARRPEIAAQLLGDFRIDGAPLLEACGVRALPPSAGLAAAARQAAPASA